MDEIDVQALADSTIRIALRVLFFGALIAGCVNGIALVYWQPLDFQRLGTVWIALIVVIFGFGRITVSNLRSVIETPSDLPVFTLAGKDGFLTRHLGPSEDAVQMLNDPSKLQQAHHLLRLIDNRMSVRVLPVELLWLAIATLQSGYGELFHCMINGKGWTQC